MPSRATALLEVGQPTSSRGSTKPRGASKPSRIRDVNFTVPPLDEGIREIVCTLIAHGIETYESCQGGDGHAYHEPTVRFESDLSEGLRAVAVALAYGFPVSRLQRVWAVTQSMLHEPWWEMILVPPRPKECEPRD